MESGDPPKCPGPERSLESSVITLGLHAWAVLGAPPARFDATAAREVIGQLSAIVTELSAGMTDQDVGEEPRALLGAVVVLQRELRDRARLVRPAVRAAIETALEELATAASATELIARAPAGLCAACGFDRALLSRVQGSTWTPDNLHVQVGAVHPGNVALAEFVGNAPIPLAASVLEANMVRRRAPALVSDTTGKKLTYPPIVERSETRAYVAAPVVVGDVVVGIFHADRLSTGGRLSIEDRDHAQAYADGVGVLFEKAIAVEGLQEATAQVSRSLKAAQERSAQDTHAPEGMIDPPGSKTRPATGIASLTRREREVLSLIASGLSNAGVASQLVVSESTIKSHMSRIMSKLGTRNRAKCVAMLFAHERRPT